MRLNYCTLFDSKYLSRGLAMYHSLLLHSDNFQLYILALDEQCFQILSKLDLKFTTIIPLGIFESNKLLKAKTNRSWGEYCWTCSSSIIKFCLQKYKLTNCTYVDSDIFFFDDPRKLIIQMKNNSVLITRHNYLPEYDQSGSSGIYCVQFVTFKNGKNGIRVLNWWVKQTLNWCYNRSENGKYGDQKYLDNWPSQFKGVYELHDLGGGVAPWNASRFKIEKYKKLLLLTDKDSTNKYILNFYHFHEIEFYDILGQIRYVTNKNFAYKIPTNIKDLVYSLYFSEIRNSFQMIRNIDPEFDDGLSDIKTYMHNYLHKYLGI